MVTEISHGITLGGEWKQVDLKSINDCYLIVCKDRASVLKGIDIDTIRKVRFQIAIDSGVKNNPITINYVNIDFTDITSESNSKNDMGFAKLTGLPSTFFIKAISVDDGDKSHTTGTFPIIVNVNAAKLR